MKKAMLALCLFLMGEVILSQEITSANAIEKTIAPQGWMIRTRSAVYQLIVNDKGEVIPVYFGATAQSAFGKENPLWTNRIQEVPVRGGFADETPAVEVVFADRVRDIELIFQKADILEVDGYPTLKITQKDKVYPLEIVSFLRVIPQSDIIEKWMEVKNTGKKDPIRVENLQSASVSLPAASYDLTYMSGYWAHEFQMQTTRLTPGIKTLQVKDFKSYGAPWFMVQKEGEKAADSGPAWFGSLHYSGNWRIDFDKAPEGALQISGGINFWDSWWTLKAGEVFVTPKFAIGYTEGGSEGVALALSGYAKEQILPKATVGRLRPVIYNSWYATTFDVNEEHQLALAKIAKSLGVETFVIDDGWFKGRVTDNAGLGDWTVDVKKFPNGLNPLIKKINDLGLDFGLWVEPEMVNPNSDLYRAHPDWVLHFPNRTRLERRNQLVLNLARQDVYDYLLQTLGDLLKNHNIKYLKWDMNRPISEPGWPAATLDMQREVRIRYTQNLYKLIDELKKRFPDVLFENCSSGGGRVDLGMLARTDVDWASDNTDPVDRLFIQYAYLGVFPANTMLGLTTYDDAHQQQPSLSYKFDVGMCGVLGVGHDIIKWTNEEKSLVTEKILKYKQIRPLVQNGILHRLVSPYEKNRCALQFVSTDKNEAVLCLYNLSEIMEGVPNGIRRDEMLKLAGLDPLASYKIEGDEQTYQGAYLMDIGIGWPVKGSFNSKILTVEKVN